jgi:hypothetical protein
MGLVDSNRRWFRGFEHYIFVYSDVMIAIVVIGDKPFYLARGELFLCE